MAVLGGREALEGLSAPNTRSKFPKGSWDPQNSPHPIGTLETQRQPCCSRARQRGQGAGQRGWHPARVLQLEVKHGLEVGGVGCARGR